MDSPRAVTKILLPGKRGTLLHRPRLTNFLLEHIDRKLLLVSASAGYGKTSLLTDFAHETPLPVCWYSLDSSDSDPHTFLEYIVFSLQRRYPEFGKRTMALLANSSPARDLDAIVGTLVTEIYEEIPDYFVLVLDDYQTVEDSEPVNKILDTLLRLLPENAHLILSGRTMPSRITITRLAAHQEIAGLGVSDLQFSAGEIKELVQHTYHIALSDTQADELAQHSEGWITGILLTTHSLWQGLFQDLVRLEGSQVNVFNYLATEVFSQQPVPLKRFLLDSSVLSHMNAKLCDSVLGIQNASDLLQLVEQRNLFLTRLEGEIAWYRYHHLFREYLHSQFKTSEPERWRHLHLGAARYLAANGQFDEAILHYVEVGEFSDAASVIEKIAKDIYESGRWTTLNGWIGCLPSEVMEKHPQLIVWQARVLGETGRLQDSLALFSQAIGIYEKTQDPAGLGNALVKQAVFLRYQGKYDRAIEDCERALRLLENDNSATTSEAHRSIGIAASLAGDLGRGVRELEQALQVCEANNDLANAARVHHDLGVAFRTLGRREAETHFLQALGFWKRTKNAIGLAYTLNSMGVTYHRAGNYGQAIETLDEALRCSRDCGQMRVEALTLASLGDVYRDMGEFDRAEPIYRSAFEIAQQINESFLITYVLVALGTVFRLNGDFQSADEVLQNAMAQASSHHSSYESGLAKTEHGLLVYLQGNASKATQELKQAANVLLRVGAKSDCARAHLHLARIYFEKKRLKNAVDHLEIVAELGNQSQERQFAFCEGKGISPLLKYAVARKIGAEYFAGILDQINRPVQKSMRQKTEPGTAARVLRVAGFGIGTVHVGDKQVAKSEWSSITAKELFFLLLAHPDGLRKEQILTLLWTDMSPAKANGIFHPTAWRMRRALGRDVILYENGQYRLNPKVTVRYDVAEFLDLIGRAKFEHDVNTKKQLYQKAIALYSGDFFEDSYSEWTVTIRSELLHHYLACLTALAHLDEEHGRKESAIHVYERILAKDCYREDIYRQVIRLYAEIGDRAAAMSTLQKCKRSMEEANLVLSDETQDLAADIG